MNHLSFPVSFKVRPDGTLEKLPDMLVINVQKVFGRVDFGMHWWELEGNGLRFCQRIREFDGDGNLVSSRIEKGEGLLILHEKPKPAGLLNRLSEAWRVLRGG